jgi:hypothetical protein
MNELDELRLRHRACREIIEAGYKRLKEKEPQNAEAIERAKKMLDETLLEEIQLEEWSAAHAEPPEEDEE